VCSVCFGWLLLYLTSFHVRECTVSRIEWSRVKEREGERQSPWLMKESSWLIAHVSMIWLISYSIQKRPIMSLLISYLFYMTWLIWHIFMSYGTWCDLLWVSFAKEPYKRDCTVSRLEWSRVKESPWLIAHVSMIWIISYSIQKRPLIISYLFYMTWLIWHIFMSYGTCIHDVTYYRSLLQKSPIKETEMNDFVCIHAFMAPLNMTGFICSGFDW